MVVRVIVRKLYRHQALADQRYGNLMHYAEDLRNSSPQSYALFYERFAAILYQDYHTYLPRFAHGIDDLYEYLLNNPNLVAEIKANSFSVDRYPSYLHEYLHFSYPDGMMAASILPTLDFIKPDNDIFFNLPKPRSKSLICKYESGNPYKEKGLKSHFDRIGSYSFVSRLQSIRYLRGSKASEDRIELISGDCLGGIFTNKEKSIYYYIFLTENDPAKALNACRVLNGALYGNYVEE